MSTTPDLTSSAPAQTSTNAIPNLKGGYVRKRLRSQRVDRMLMLVYHLPLAHRSSHSAHPATPKLAGIICGSSILFGARGLRNPESRRAASLTPLSFRTAWTVCLIYWWWNRRKEKKVAAEVLRMKVLRADATASPVARRSRANSRRYPPNTTVLERPTSPSESRRSGEGRRPDHVHGPSRHPGTLTPMAEVPSRFENGDTVLGGSDGLGKR